MSRSPSRRLLPVVAAALFLAPAAGSAESGIDTTRQHFIQGTVRDPGGRPVPGVRIDDGTQAVATDPAGRYQLAEPGPGIYFVTASSDRTYLARARVTLSAPPVALASVANFTLPYSLQGTWQTGASSRTLTIASGAPSPGTPGEAGSSCVAVVDLGTGASLAAVSTGEQDSAGAAIWTATLGLETQQVRLIAKDCGSSASLSGEASPVFLVSVDPVTLPSDPVRRWSATAFPTIAFPASDTGSGIDPDSAWISIDGAPVATGFTNLNFQGQARALAPGDHVVGISIADRAGNRSTLAYLLTVEMIPPELADPAPSGEISDRSPTIEVTAADNSSGIDPGSIQLVLSNGILSSHLSATYDPATGRILYIVPDVPQGTDLGEFPLPDGDYEVTATVRDVAGNVRVLSWPFIVRTVP